MGKNGDNIKVLFEKAREGDVTVLISLTRAFRKWLRLSFVEELSQPFVRRLIDKFLHQLNKIAWIIEKRENILWKTKAAMLLSRLMETIYNSRDLGTAIKHLERILHGFEGIHEAHGGVKSSGEIINRLAEIPQETMIESSPAYYRKLSLIKKKRGGCTGGGGKVSGGVDSGSGGGDGDGGSGDGDIEDFLEDQLEDFIEDKIEDKSEETREQPQDRKGRIERASDGVLKEKKREKEIEKKEKTTDSLRDNTKGKVKKEYSQLEEQKIPEEKLEEISPVIFRVHWERYTMPKLWTNLLVYLFSGSRGEKNARVDFFMHTEQNERYDTSISRPLYLKHGTEIRIKPEMPGFLFNPSEYIVTWYEDYHHVSFRMLPLLEGPFEKDGDIIFGQVNFFVGPVLIGEIGINITIRGNVSKEEKDIKDENESSGYQKIFASYAREDSDIVQIMDEVYSAFGNYYMRDLKTLRSGLKWKPSILKLIKEADVFQLYWSYSSKSSKYVEMEWREALNQKKNDFIRPAYWENPMPPPPHELEDIHFNDIGKLIHFFKKLILFNEPADIDKRLSMSKTSYFT